MLRRFVPLFVFDDAFQVNDLGKFIYVFFIFDDREFIFRGQIFSYIYN